MAKIAFLGNFQVDYSSETHHVKSLESLGHTVVKLQERQATAQEIYREASRCDLFIWVHTHGWKTPGNTGMDVVLAKLNRHGIPTMTYHLDLWFGLRRQQDLQKDNFYKTIGHFFELNWSFF